MKEQPKQEQYYDGTVWTNLTTESVRREECLCRNCGNLNIQEPEKNCSISNELFVTIKRHNLAMIITRCHAWKPKP